MLEEQITRTRTFAALDTLEFLRRSGRMNFALAFLGSLLHIKPFLKMYNGNPTAERIRTRGKAMKRLVELLEQAAPLEKVALLHSRAADRAEALQKASPAPAACRGDNSRGDHPRVGRPHRAWRGWFLRHFTKKHKEQTMKLAKAIALLGLLAMTAVLIYGFTVGDFAGEGSPLLDMPWGIVSLVDLYVGFTLFSGWIIYREKALLPSIIWVDLDDGAGLLGRGTVHLPRPADQRRRLEALLVG